MNENEKAKQDEFREVWIESLLVSAANPQEHTDRVARAMEQIGKDSDAPHSVDAVREQARSLRWWTLAIAASFLLVLLFLVDDYLAVGQLSEAAEVLRKIIARDDSNQTALNALRDIQESI